MKGLKKRFTAFALIISFLFTIFLGTSPVNAEVKPLAKDKMIQLIKDEISKKKLGDKFSESISKKFTEDGYVKNENGSTSKASDPEESIRIIVQLSSKSASEILSSNATDSERAAEEKKVKDQQKNIVSSVQNITGVKVRSTFGYLVNGFSITAKRKYINKIAAIGGVKNVTEAKVYYPDMKFADNLTQTYSVWQDLGYKGQGMVVSIIDTGIDYNHKDLVITDKSKEKLTADKVSQAAIGKGKYFTDKVPFAYNYADGNLNVIDSGVNEMHGMHVAGIVAANGKSSDIDTFKAVKGVAPEAQLLDMKVFSNNPDLGGAYDDDVIAAIEDSVKLGADVINMSLGSDSGFQDADDPEQKVIKNAADKGVVVVISAGNSALSASSDGWATPQENLLGTVDTATVGAPGLAEDSVCVASYENSDLTGGALNYTSTSDSGKMFYLPGSGDPAALLSSANDLVDCNLGQDFTGIDVNGKIALIMRGGNSFADKVNRAEAAGAVGVIVYNKSTESGAIAMGGLDGITTPSVGISYSDGLKLKSLISSNLKVNFTGAMTSTPNSDANDMSQYTSWGPTPNLEFKPEVSAPGGDIYSLANNNSYQSMSGTSMAAPHTAGSEALIIQAIKEKNLGLTGRDLFNFAKITTINTAKTEMDKRHTTVPYTPRRQGAGLVQIKNAMENNVLVTDENGKAAVSLKQIGNTTTFKLKLKNYGTDAAVYNLSHSGVLAEVVDSVTGEVYDKVISGANLSFDKTSVTVPGKGEVEVTVTLNISDNFDKNQFAEGFVYLKSDSAVDLVVPYFGFYGDWSEPQIVDKSMFDNDCIIGTTSIGTLDLAGGPFSSSYFPYGTSSDTVGFSPNDDDLFDSAYPYAYLLRNAKELSVQVLDKDKKVLGILDKENKVSRNLLEDAVSTGEWGKALTGGKWDGTVYNAHTGGYDKLPEGQYFMRITTKADIEGAKEQTVDMPVKIDLTAPELNITSAETSDTENYALTWNASDAATGMFDDIIMVFVNGKEVLYDNSDEDTTNDLSLHGNNYSINLNLEEGKKNLVEIITLDGAGNIGYTNNEVSCGSIIPVTFDNMPASLNKIDLINNKYTLTGQVSDDTAALKINNNDAAITDGTFKAVITPVQGTNTISVVALASDNTELFNQNYTFDCDSIAPVLNITSPDVDENGIFYTESGTVNVSGNVMDTHFNKLVVNDEEFTVDSDGNFSKDFNVPSGLSAITFDAYDDYDNVTENTLLVAASIYSEPFTVNFSNLSGIDIMNGKDAVNDVYTIEGYVNHTTKVFTINGDPVTVNKDLSFTKDIKLEQGTNRIKVYAEDENKNILYDYCYKILFDSKAPTISIISPIAKGDGKVYTNQDSITVKGTVTDNTYGYSFFINGDAVMTVDRYPLTDPDAIRQTFSKEIAVKDGDFVKLDLVDEFGNITSDSFQVVVDKTVPEAPEITLSTTDITNKPVIASISSKETKLEKIEYSFDGGKIYLPYEKPISIAANSEITARVTDYAGNVSPVTTKKITNIDTKAPVISTNIEEGKVYENSLKPTVTTDEKASLTMKLDGKSYNGDEIIGLGSHTLEIKAVDAAENSSTEVINFNITAVVNQNADEKSVGEAVKNAVVNNGEAIPVTFNNGKISSDFIDEVKDSGKKIAVSIVVKSGSYDLLVTFTVDAKDLKPVDFTLNNAAPNDANIKKLDKNAQILSFKDNGSLPAGTKLKIKVDSSKVDVNKGIYFYFYNPTTNRTELIGENLKVDKDGYITVSITHCSDYFLSNINNTKINNIQTSLVKTGSFVDTGILMTAGLMLVLAGVYVVIRRRKTNI